MTIDVEYPYCRRFKGTRRIKCYINAIMRDKIPKKKKIRRLVYLIALNKVHKWTKMRTVRKLVKEALERLKKK